MLSKPWKVSTSFVTVFRLANGYCKIGQPVSKPTTCGWLKSRRRIILRPQFPTYVAASRVSPVTSTTVLAATYVGNWGRKMSRLRDFNQPQVVGFDTGCPILQYP